MMLAFDDAPTAAATHDVWITDDLSVSVPTVAGVCNALYGGFYTNAASRRLAADLETAWPPFRDHLYAGRHLQRRMLRYLLDAGVEQFLDIGGGVAEHGATHEIIADLLKDPGAPAHPGTTSTGGPARRARVVYVDLDPIITDVNRRHLHDLGWATAVVGDLRQPHSFLDDPTVNDVLDLGQPVAVLLLGVLHHLPSSTDLAQTIGTITDALMPGSYLAISHLTTDPDRAGAAAQHHAAALLARTPTPLHLRIEQNVAELLHDPTLPRLRLVAPSLVPAHRWRPDRDEPVFPAPQLLAALTQLSPNAPVHGTGRR